MFLLLILLSFSSFAQSLDGDFRFRNEQTHNNSIHSDRNRIRIRINGNHELKPNLKLKAQIATGDSQTSSNQTLGEGKMNFRFQQLYVEKIYNKFSFGLGKLKNPFYRSNRSQVVWDNDYNPEGINLKYGSNNFDLNLAYFDVYGNIKHIGGQIVYKNNFMKLGLSYYQFNTKNNFFIFDNPNGNSGVNKLYSADFKIMSSFAEINYKFLSFNLELYKNNSTPQSNNAYRVSVKAGEKNFFMYSYQHSEKDSTLGSLSESNIQGGQSDTKGHILRFRYYLDEHIFLTYNQYFSQSISRGENFRRSQFDLNFSF